MKDGDENTVDCELVLVYQEPDHSVGINGGFGVHALRIRGVLYELEETDVPVAGRFDRARDRVYALGVDGTAALNAEAMDASEDAERSGLDEAADEENYR